MKTMIEVICILCALVGCSTGATFIKVRGTLPHISPDSRRYVFSSHGNAVLVRDAVSDSLLFSTTLEGDITNLCWLDEETFLATSPDEVYMAVDIITGTSKELVKLRGVVPWAMNMDKDQVCLYVVDGSYAYDNEDDPKSTVWVYNLETDSLRRYDFDLNLSFTFSLVHLGGDSLILNAGGTLSILDLSTGDLTSVRDSHDNKIVLGESGINVLPDRNTVVFSLATKSVIASLSMNSRELTVVPELAGYLYPEIAPNCEFMYVTDTTYPYPTYRVEGLPFLKELCKE